MNPAYFSMVAVLLFSLTAGILTYASLADIASRKVPFVNHLTLVLFIVGFFGHALISGWAGVWQSFIGFAILGTVGLVGWFFVRDSIGGADTKLLAGVGAVLGFGMRQTDPSILSLYLLWLVIGGSCWVLIVAAINYHRHKDLKAAFSNIPFVPAITTAFLAMHEVLLW